MSTVLLYVGAERRFLWKACLQEHLHRFTIVLHGDDRYDPADVLYAVVWAPPSGLLRTLANLRCVFSVGAGVEHVLKDPEFPRATPLMRNVGETLSMRLSEYVCLHVLALHRNFSQVVELSRNATWRRLEQKPARDVKVGVMGLGRMGMPIARSLRTIGYDVRGLTVSGRSELPVPVHRADDPVAFFTGLDVLVCALPRTASTCNIIERQTLAMMSTGSWVINVGRGDQVDEEALLAALASGHLSGAVLDVFKVEPLPPQHPFWRHPQILVTSHSAGYVDPESGSKDIAASLIAFDAGRPMDAARVDMTAGY